MNVIGNWRRFKGLRGGAERSVACDNACKLYICVYGYYERFMICYDMMSCAWFSSDPIWGECDEGIWLWI
jgi:hypothetical protein